MGGSLCRRMTTKAWPRQPGTEIEKRSGASMTQIAGGPTRADKHRKLRYPDQKAEKQNDFNAVNYTFIPALRAVFFPEWSGNTDSSAAMLLS